MSKVASLFFTCPLLLLTTWSMLQYNLHFNHKIMQCFILYTWSTNRFRPGTFILWSYTDNHLFLFYFMLIKMNIKVTFATKTYIQYKAIQWSKSQIRYVVLFGAQSLLQHALCITTHYHIWCQDCSRQLLHVWVILRCQVVKSEPRKGQRWNSLPRYPWKQRNEKNGSHSRSSTQMVLLH